MAKIKFLEVSTVFVFDRSNPNEVVSWDPKTNKHTTRLEDIREAVWARNDIGMVNLVDEKGNVVEQPCVYGNKDGSVDWNGVQYHFSIVQQKKIIAIVQRLVEVSKEFPEMGKYLQ